MISRESLHDIAEEKLNDARILLDNSSWNGAVYLSGYAIVRALKARICTTLGWNDFPHTTSEFSNFRSFKTHNLDVLLTLSGMEQHIRDTHITEWSTVATWDPEVRYRNDGVTTHEHAVTMIDAVEIILEALR